MIKESTGSCERIWPRNVNELTLDQVRALRAKPGGTAPMTFVELTMACKGRLRLMLDIKEPSHSARFYNEILKELNNSGLLESVYLIGLEEARPYFKGQARISATSAELERPNSPLNREYGRELTLQSETALPVNAPRS